MKKAILYLGAIAAACASEDGRRIAVKIVNATRDAVPLCLALPAD